MSLNRASVQTSTTDTLTASVIGAATETAFATTYVIPANYLVTGKALKLTCVIKYTGTGGGPSITFQGRLQKSGPVNVYFATFGASSPGATTSYRNCTFYIAGSAAASTTANVFKAAVGMGSAPMSADSVLPPIVVDTTVAQTIQFTVIYSANTGGNSITLSTLIIEEVNNT